jgi:hypothetical protein
MRPGSVTDGWLGGSPVTNLRLRQVRDHERLETAPIVGKTLASVGRLWQRRRREQVRAPWTTVIASVGGVARTSTAVWRIRPEIVVALAERLGEPVDRYVNGSHTWFTETPGGVALEWRLHPVAGYVTPKGLSHNDVWDAVVDGLAGAGPARVSPDQLWDGLECFAAYGDDIEPARLSAAATAELGLAPDAAGLVDHESIGDRWERTGGAVSVVGLLLDQLQR